ncbi:hypothetical protein PpBr36_01913, partial [Pyricularia pennisetigena]|uniref:hypothetical protein n=1 Tax=Pyricularia pennisetigena TaxID=1578925 RepID=UPI00114E0447
ETTEQVINRLRSSARAPGQRSNLALAYNLCRAKIQHLDGLSRDEQTPRAPASIHAAAHHQKRKRVNAAVTSTATTTSLTTMAIDSSPPAAEAAHPHLPRHAFVTIGATAGFRSLLEQVLRPEFLRWMRAYGFARMTVQCGSDLDWFRSSLAAADTCGVEVECFRYTTSMRDYILPCRPVEGVANAGIVICHAGAGTVVDVSRCGVPFVVVPNEGLMDNHQAELAAHLDKERWAVAAKPDALPQAIRRAHEQAYAGGLAPQPSESGAVGEDAGFPPPEHERITLLDWMTLSCYDEQISSTALGRSSASDMSSENKNRLATHPHARHVS